MPRRLPAEALLDCIAEVTERSEKFGNYPEGWRAIQVRDSRIGNYMLQVFGRPKREILCACERQLGSNLAQSLNLINGSTLNMKLEDKKGRIAHLMEQYAPIEPALANPRIVDELYLLALTRYPLPKESRVMVDYITKAADRKQAIQDALWALLNSQEFLFEH